MAGIPGFRRPEGFAVVPRPHRLPVLLIALAVALAVMLILLRGAVDDRTGLAGLRLSGPRGPACVEVDVLLDESGSMQRFAAARVAALRQVLAWAPRNLRADDRLAVLGWAERAAVLLPATRAADLAAARIGGAPALGDRTRVTPALRAVATLPDAACSRWLVVIRDGEIGDEPAPAQAAARAARVRGLSLLLPSGSAVPQRFAAAAPYASALSAPVDDADRTALAVARAIADATGQALQR